MTPKVEQEVAESKKVASSERFQAAMPNIPGLNKPMPRRTVGLPEPVSQLILFSLPLLVLAIIGLFVWQHVRTSLVRKHVSTVASPRQIEKPPVPIAAQPAVPGPAGPVEVATVDELEKPWAAKKFTFVKPDSLERIPAVVVRLPGTPGDQSAGYWGFSLAAPYGLCNLEYITNLKDLAGRFNYPENHPMVAAPCDGTLFDPLRMGMTPAGAWVRGEVVQGAGIRPPVSIRIQVKGKSLIADRME